MQKAKQGQFTPFNASSWKIGLVVSDFNINITEELMKSAIKRSMDYGISQDSIDVVHVAGAVEIPLVLQQMSRSKKYKTLLALGCVIKGETPHFDYVCKYVTEGILRVQLDEQMPIGFGILTCNTHDEALSRISLGSDHMDAVLHQAKVLDC